jgi:hypothetical protein
MKLTRDDAAWFYDVFFKLIDYTNDRYQVVPGLGKTSGAEDVDPTAIMPVRDKLWGLSVRALAPSSSGHRQPGGSISAVFIKYDQVSFTRCE